ncbi:MAG: tetratricopeptide repeat protein [Pseudomonadota bacterium]
MHDIHRWRTALALISLIVLSILQTPVRAGETTEASVLVAEAEQALAEKEYLEAAVAYRKAAELSDSVEVARKATRVAFTYGFDEEAMAAGKRWVKLDKESQEARAYLGQIYFRLSDLRNSRRQYQRLLKIDTGEDPGKRILELLDYLREERQPERAYELIRTLAKPYEDSWYAQYAVAIVALQAGDSTAAMERANIALKLDPDSGKPHMILARALMFDGKDDEAIEYLADVIGDSPNPDADARMELALMYMLTGRDDDALSQVSQVMLENSGRVDALRLMAIINFRLERIDAAWDDFEDLLATGQYRMDALYYMARISDYREEYERAVRLYREVRWGMNTIFSQRRASSLLAHQLDDVDGAFQLLDEFAEASPNHAVDMVVSKAQLLVSLDRYDEGLELFDKAVKYRPDDEEMMLSRAALLLEMDRLDDAIAQYRKSLERWPNSALTLNALGYTLADRTDQFDEAEVLIRRAYELQPDNGAITDSMGWILYKVGRKQEGLEFLEKAYAMIKDSEIAAHIVEVLAELDRREEAMEILDSASRRDPDSELLLDVRTRYFPDTSE